MILQFAKGKQVRKYEVEDSVFQGKKIGDVLETNVGGVDCRLEVTGATTNIGAPCSKSYPFIRYKKIKVTKKTGKRRLLVYGNFISKLVTAVSAKIVP